MGSPLAAPVALYDTMVSCNGRREFHTTDRPSLEKRTRYFGKDGAKSRIQHTRTLVYNSAYIFQRTFSAYSFGLLPQHIVSAYIFQHLFNIFSTSFQHLFNIFSTSFQHLFNIFSTSFQHLFNIFSTSFQHLFNIFSTSFQHLFNIFSTSFQHLFNVFSTCTYTTETPGQTVLPTS